MSINPIKTTENIRDEYSKYLKSMFFFKDKELKNIAENTIDANRQDLVKGPYLESTAMYKTGSTLDELIEEGVLSKDFRRLVHSIGRYPLYAHQEKAIRKAIAEEKNMIVATGTGSGKTECFLIPILDYLVRQNELGKLSPGVRVLILYPMNALANDQLKRLRKVLKDYPEITFGRYTGETKESKNDALTNFKEMNPKEEVLQNELLSRTEMKKTPPHILLTNYAMLEYLLLRPEDNVFFDGVYSDAWKYVVLDEAHVYTGALGSEISYLLARLKDRVVDGERGRLKFIATSATLGDGKDANKEIVDYANYLFDEEFFPDAFITSERKVEDRKIEGLVYPNISFYTEFLEKSRTLTADALIMWLNDEGVYGRIENKDNIEEIIYDALMRDRYIYDLKKYIESKTDLLINVVVEIFGDDKDESIDNFLAMVELAARAKKEDNSDVLLPARYHSFAKATEGVFVSFEPKKQVFINRRASVGEKDNIKVFELANCVNCGQEYIIGKCRNGKIEQHSGYYEEDNQRSEYYLIADNYNEVEIDDDTLLGDEKKKDIKLDGVIEFSLCLKCARLYNKGEGIHTCCGMDTVKVYKVQNRGNSINPKFAIILSHTIIANLHT